MKAVGSAMMWPFQLLATCALFVATANGVAYEVSSCADMLLVDDSTVTAITVTSSEITCVEYTRFRVRNAMMISATVPQVTFSNIALKVLGELTVEPDVLFTGVNEQEKRGAVLHISDGATATFMGKAEFNENSNAQRELPDLPCEDVPEWPLSSTSFYNTRSYVSNDCTIRGWVPLNGGCIYNRGTLVFEDEARFDENYATTERDSGSNGGAIANTATGTILFKGKLTMLNSYAESSFAGGKGYGGAIYNRGDVVVEGEAFFAENSGSEGGAIHNRRTGSLVFNSLATFFDNGASDYRGGAVFNMGGQVSFNAGSMFKSNSASSNGEGGSGGAIYNRNGLITFVGSTTFKENRSGGSCGAMCTSSRTGATTYIFPSDPADISFEGNSSEDGGECDDINGECYTG